MSACEHACGAAIQGTLSVELLEGSMLWKCLWLWDQFVCASWWGTGKDCTWNGVGQDIVNTTLKPCTLLRLGLVREWFAISMTTQRLHRHILTLAICSS